MHIQQHVQSLDVKRMQKQVLNKLASTTKLDRGRILSELQLCASLLFSKIFPGFSSQKQNPFREKSSCSAL